jgi:2-C-methyl-D-erythritol 4-phosphate cytidylyltransferase / 2-C-methyl-D-erythritol 2,4-cyclodiphosphate synthase
MIEWSIDALLRAGCAPIVVAVPAGLLDDASGLLSPNAVTVVEGGSTRQASVARALEHVSTDRVLVHDASRPLIRVELVHRVIEALGGAQAAIPALPMEETMKAVSDDRVVGTILRGGLWRAQTPQGFDTETLRAAHEKAIEEGFEATDDCGLIERYGGKAAIVWGDRRNLKITYPEDFDLAEALLGESE